MVAEEVSTVVAEVSAAATVEGMPMAVGEWVRCTAAAATAELAAVRRRAALAVEGVPLEVEGLAADGPAGVQEIEGT